MDEKSVSPYYGQIEEFFTRLRELGYNKTDFAVRCLEWPTTAKPASAMSDLVIVKSTSSGIEMAYAADTSGKWLLSALDDLHNGVFDLLEQSMRQFSVMNRDQKSESQT